MRFPRKAVLALGAAVTLLTVAAPAAQADEAFGTGVNACNQDSVATPLQSTTHQAYIIACFHVDNALQATAQISNTGLGANYSVTAQLRRSSDGALIAQHNCQAFVPEYASYYCTKAWPKASGAYYVIALATRSGQSTQARDISETYYV